MIDYNDIYSDIAEIHKYGIDKSPDTMFYCYLIFIAFVLIMICNIA